MWMVNSGSGDENNSDGVDDGGVNINGGDDANRVDGENIVDCIEDKDVSGDSIGDGGVDTNGDSDPDLGMTSWL